jgi:LPS-assembly protein
MTKRGVMLGNEFRFLQPTYSGTLLYDVIQNDRQTEESRDYTGVRLNYSGPSGVAAGINYNRVSDDNYFVDFSSTILGSSQKVLPQDGFVSYTQTYWNTAVRVTKNQILQDPLAPVTPPYERVPQVTVNGFVADWNGFEAAAILDGTRFTNPDSGLQPGSRYIFNPRVAYPILSPGWFITPRAQLSATYYSLDPDFNPQDKSQSRVMPILSLDTGLIFERDTEWFGRSSQQTLEPRLYYAYIPFRDQNQLPNFDSALADLNYAQFFTENIYSGYDRIVNANQLTFAVGTRVLDEETGAERLAQPWASVTTFGQKVTLPESHAFQQQSDLLATLTAQRAITGRWTSRCSTPQRKVRCHVPPPARWQPGGIGLSAYYRYQESSTRAPASQTDPFSVG